LPPSHPDIVQIKYKNALRRTKNNNKKILLVVGPPLLLLGDVMNHLAVEHDQSFDRCIIFAFVQLVSPSVTCWRDWLVRA
jgi:hypothetical protein